MTSRCLVYVLAILTISCSYVVAADRNLQTAEGVVAISRIG